MANIQWPGFRVNGFEMRVVSNTRKFTGAYVPTTQVVDLLGERWKMTVSIAPTTSDTEAAAREAFFDRMAGQSNTVTLGHQKRFVPLGTLQGANEAQAWRNASNALVSWVNASSAGVQWYGGDGVVHADIPQLSGTATLRTLPGRTLKAGDHLGLPGGQLVRVLADTTANGSGLMAIEFRPRARQFIANGGGVVTNRPTAQFRMTTDDGSPVAYSPGMSAGTSFDLIEAL